MKTLNFSIEGEFVTNLAREKCYYEGKMDYAIELLESCLQTDDLTNNEIRDLALSILDGRAKIVGIYPGDDYGIEEINPPDSNWRLCNLIKNNFEKIDSLEKENTELSNKFSTLAKYCPEHVIQTAQDDYEFEYGESMFKESNDDWYPDSTLVAIDKYNKANSCLLTTNTPHRYEAYGWLEPNGTYHPVEWSDHSSWAANYLDEHYPFIENRDLYWSKPDARGNRSFYVNGDVLVYKLGWVLLDSPMQGQACVTRDESRELTKAQKEFLYDYFKDYGRDKEANDLYSDEELDYN